MRYSVRGFGLWDSMEQGGIAEWIHQENDQEREEGPGEDYGGQKGRNQEEDQRRWGVCVWRGAGGRGGDRVK